MCSSAPRHSTSAQARETTATVEIEHDGRLILATSIPGVLPQIHGSKIGSPH